MAAVLGLGWCGAQSRAGSQRHWAQGQIHGGCTSTQEVFLEKVAQAIQSGKSKGRVESESRGGKRREEGGGARCLPAHCSVALLWVLWGPGEGSRTSGSPVSLVTLPHPQHHTRSEETLATWISSLTTTVLGVASWGPWPGCSLLLFLTQAHCWVILQSQPASPMIEGTVGIWAYLAPAGSWAYVTTGHLAWPSLQERFLCQTKSEAYPCPWGN